MRNLRLSESKDKLLNLCAKISYLIFAEREQILAKPKGEMALRIEIPQVYAFSNSLVYSYLVYLSTK